MCLVVRYQGEVVTKCAGSDGQVEIIQSTPLTLQLGLEHAEGLGRPAGAPLATARLRPMFD